MVIVAKQSNEKGLWLNKNHMNSHIISMIHWYLYMDLNQIRFCSYMEHCFIFNILLTKMPPSGSLFTFLSVLVPIDSTNIYVNELHSLPPLYLHQPGDNCFTLFTWWRHQMETFSALLALCAGNSPVTGEFPSQRPVTWCFDVFFDLRLNKRLSKQTWGWWFETPSNSLWRHCNVDTVQLLTSSLLGYVTSIAKVI